MDNLEDQLNELLAQSDRVSAELKREIYLVERADAAIRYLRAAREKTAHEVAGLLANRSSEPLDSAAISDGSASPGDEEPSHTSYGPYDPRWPRVVSKRG